MSEVPGALRALRLKLKKGLKEGRGDPAVDRKLIAEIEAALVRWGLPIDEFEKPVGTSLADQQQGQGPRSSDQ